MRSRETLESVSVCQDMQALIDPTVQTRGEFKRHSHEDCPLFAQCASGRLLGPSLRNCTPMMAMKVARIASIPGATLEGEMEDFRTAPVFSAMGFINAYENPDPNAVTTDRDEICREVKELAEVFLGGVQPTLDQQIRQAHCERHPSFTEGCANCAMAKLVIDDATEVVYPNGIAKRVARGQCRCPIVDVGDFCPVHGG